MLVRELSAAADPRVWDGWDGDRYATFDCAGAAAFTWLTSWDSEYDAEQFADSYRSMAPVLASRAALSEAPRIELHGKEALVFTPNVEPYARAALAGAQRRRVWTLEQALAGSASVAATATVATTAAVADSSGTRVSAAGPTR
jgi:hypothetical protein